MPKNTDKPSASTKSAGADYPVDAAERVNQEARLKKAAAAGARASNAPIPGLMLQKPSPLSPAQQLAEPPAPLSNAPTPALPFAETPPDRSAPRIHDDEVLVELRKISAWADLQRKITRGSLIFVAILVPVAIGAGILLERNLKTTLETNTSPLQPDWYDVDRQVRQGDFDKATTLGEALLLKTPQFPEAHRRLAGAYLAAGNLEKAREHYAEAFRLFPSEENEKLLNAIEKRILSEHPGP